MKKTRALTDKNKHVLANRQTDFRKMTHENSQLIIELNLLRDEKRRAENRIKDLENSIYTMAGSMSGTATNVSGGATVGQNGSVLFPPVNLKVVRPKKSAEAV